MQFFKDLSLSAFTAGFVAVLVGFTSSVALVFQAAQSFGATQEVMASWMWALGLGMGLCTLLPSLWWRKPVMVAWSTPGAAVLASAGLGGGFGMAEAVGAFIACALLITLFGATGWFEKWMNRLPVSIASALLAGVLARFGMAAFGAAQADVALVVLMLLTYLLGKRWIPRYAVPLTLLVSMAWVGLGAGFGTADIALQLTTPVWVTPVFTFSAFVSLALPLFIVTMASQNMPGVAAIRAAGYGVERVPIIPSATDVPSSGLANAGAAGIPISPVITLTGLATLVLAPFGGYALNLSAITAAICMGPEAHADPARRYTAAVSCGAIYIVIGLFGATVIGVLTAFPATLVAAIAGLALLGTIGSALKAALEVDAEREAAIITFLVTLSGVVLWGVGAAFWGVVAGGLALLVQHYTKP